MLKELIARVIQSTNSPTVSEEICEDDIHEKIRKGVLKLLTDAGFPNLTVEVGPKQGCDHNYCTMHADVYWPGLMIDEVDIQYDAWCECTKSAFLIVSSEILGPREIINLNFTKTVTYN